ncbi:lymphocyte-specific protein 1-like [Nomascus leucogenys]|uniref:lymphocyte-specific protein 1-like n=1 Tax=Nomascus leucogenys TaxID=61853 RepID=UPI00122D6448|nr:lymphocyte-specific protein 1-like [Nomascus leucogenys]
MLPSLHACEKEDSDEVHLEVLSLSKEGPDPEDTVQDNLGATGAEEEQEEHQKYQQPRTPSPLVLEGTIEQSSPPLSPPIKLIDRTESLNCSIEKSNSVKKSQPDLPISKIDHWLEQYTQAIETAGRTPKLAHQASIELPSMAVASTKSRWETGEVQAQSAAKTPSCKDIVAGDMTKKSLWEQKGGSKTSSTIKAQIAFLQGERKGQENLKKDLVRRIKMLEYALKQERVSLCREQKVVQFLQITIEDSSVDPPQMRRFNVPGNAPAVFQLAFRDRRLRNNKPCSLSRDLRTDSQHLLPLSRNAQQNH